MRMSCNGCRVLRKGCGDNCSIRPCLQWIKSPASQAHATVFLAKFYGRAGLMNLINAGPEPLRPAIFRSLLYEACGRILNPIYGSVGLLWEGSWQLCHAATEAVLSGMPITPMASASEAVPPPLKAYDIRHVPREENPAAAAMMMAAAAGEVNGARPIRSGRFKRPGARAKAHQHPPAATVECCNEESNKSLSHESSLSHQSELGAENAEGGGGDSKETESNSMVSAETTATVAQPSQPVKAEPEPESVVGLELTLGVKPVPRESRVIPVKKRRFEQRDGACRMELGL